MRVRKITKMHFCSQHSALFYRMTRKRRAEFFDEGGPVDYPCAPGGPCRIWPGTDLFVPSVCEAMREADWPAQWAVNKHNH